MTYRDYDRGRGRNMDWGGPGNGYRGQFSRQDQFGGQGGYGGHGSIEGQGEYGAPGYSNQGQFSEPYGGQYGQDFGREGIGWQQRQFGGEPIGQGAGWEQGRMRDRGYREEERFGGWRGQEFGGYGPSQRVGESYGRYGAGNAAGGWQPNAEQGWGQGRTRAGSWDQPQSWEQGPSGRGNWGQGYSDQRSWGQSQPRQEFGGQGFGGQGRPGGTFFYEEVWLMPGPHSGRGPRGYQRSDQRIEEDICERLMQHGQVDASDIQVQVRNGEVTLTGTVENRQAKRMTEDMLDSISGVKDIHNQLRVQQGQGQIGQEVGRASTGQGRSTSRGQSQRNEPVKAGASSS